MKCTSLVYVLFLFCSLLIEKSAKAFLCNNGKIISDELFCDIWHRDDCGDGSDEGYGCNRVKCWSGYFTCKSSLGCKNITSRCDRFADCLDGSDEKQCVRYSKELMDDDCSLFNGKYLCRDKTTCIDLSNMCDGQCTCIDCSDENRNCYNFNNSCNLCPHHCLHTPNGAQCVCSSNLNESRANTSCEKWVDCTGDDSCDQNCMRYDSTTTWCSCFENFIAIRGTNGRECQTNASFENSLLYSTVSKIKVWNIDSDKVQIIRSVDAEITSLTAARKYTYYASFQDNKAEIFKFMNNSEENHKVIETDSPITSLAVDWITENIYFINNGCVCVCTNSGNTSMCVRLECSNILSNVVLAPIFGLMYYAKKFIYKDENVLMKSNMDGSEKIVFVDQSFTQAIYLSADEVRETLYWYELDRKLLHSVSFQGNNKKVRSLNFYHFTHFTAFDKIVFFLDPENGYENAFYGTKDCSVFHTYRDIEKNTINHIYAYTPFMQNFTKLRNPCSTTRCNGLCLLRPRSTKNRSNYTCLCQNHTFKNKTQWCSRPSTESAEDVEPIPRDEITLVTEQFSITTTKSKVEMTTKQLPSSKRESSAPFTSTDHPLNSSDMTTAKLFRSSDSTTKLSSSSTEQCAQTSKTDLILFGFMLGVVLISGIVALYAIFRRVYWDKRHQQMDVSQLMNLHSTQLYDD